MTSFGFRPSPAPDVLPLDPAVTAEESLAHLVRVTAGLTGREFVETLVRELGRALRMKYLMVAEVDESRRKADVVALAVDGGPARPFSYDLRHTPCEDVADGSSCYFEDSVAAKFPRDELLAEMGVESYFGVPVMLEDQRPLGILVAMGDRAQEASPWHRALLELFAPRVAAELERGKVHRQRMRSLSEGRRMVNALNRLALSPSLHNGDVQVFATEAAHVLGDAVQARTISIWLRVPGSSQMEAVAAYGRDADPVRLGTRLEVGEAYFTARRRIRVVGDDTVRDLPRGVRDFLADRQVGEHIEGAIRVRGEVEGIVALVPEGPAASLSGMALNLIADVADLVARAETEARRMAETEKRRQLELELERARKVEALGSLAGGIAHDFNNILSAVLGNAELALLDADEEMRPLLEDVMGAGRHGQELIQQIFQFVNSETVQPEPVAVRDLAAEVLRTVRPLAGGTLVKMHEEEGCELRVRGDHSQLRQAILNLCTNALDALKGTGTLELEIRAARPSETAPHPSLRGPAHCVIQVRDDGPGIPAEAQSRIFEPFFSTRKNQGGTGLGLAIVDRVVRAHDGLLELESIPGSGTTFSLFLPLHD
jgi:signal transduction histidine kinase